MKLIEEHKVFDDGQWHDVKPLDLGQRSDRVIYFNSFDLNRPIPTTAAPAAIDAVYEVGNILGISTASKNYRCEKVAYAWIRDDGVLIDWANGPDEVTIDDDDPREPRAQLYKVTPV